YFHFSFVCSADHRRLHSFPTRRSSDLAELDVVRRPHLGFSYHPSMAEESRGTGPCPAVRHAGYRLFGSASGGSAKFPETLQPWTDRKSTRLNSSHVAISYAVFCLKKKT